MENIVNNAQSNGKEAFWHLMAFDGRNRAYCNAIQVCHCDPVRCWRGNPLVNLISRNQKKHPATISGYRMLQAVEKVPKEECHCEPARRLVWQSPK